MVLVLIGLFILARTLITAELVKDLELPKVEQAQAGKAFEKD